MGYKLLYTKTAFEDIKKLDPVVKKRIRKNIDLNTLFLLII